MNKLDALMDDIMNLFHGLMYGNINYSYDKLNCAMKTDICEIFSTLAEEVVMNINLGRDVSKEQLQTLHDNLIAFAKEFKVKEARLLAKKVNVLIETL